MILNNKIHNEKPAVATDHGEFNLVFSTTHPFGKEQANAYYHDTGVRV